MVNWKSTMFGLITAAAGFVVFSPDTFHNYPVVLSLAKYIMVGGLAGIGIVAKDKDVTGAGDAARHVE